jgi:hypothetical protein
MQFPADAMRECRVKRRSRRPDADRIETACKFSIRERAWIVFWHDAIRSSGLKSPNRHLRRAALVCTDSLQGLPEVYRIENGFGLPNETIAFIIKDLPHFSAA